MGVAEAGDFSLDLLSGSSPQCGANVIGSYSMDAASGSSPRMWG